MNKALQTMVSILLITGTPLAFGHAQKPDAIDGRWNARLISRDGETIAFRLDLSGKGSALKGTLFDGFEPYDGTTSASFHDGTLVLNIEHYLTTITASLQDGNLIGTVSSQSRAQATE